ncbi:hypothetical protein R5R35_009506 [Gryllus longicercus]|uniref:Biogenesis of lysosome-related organelles complex 1 subunit 6 n=2 Tax=Gryllus longicercus TaxID=2509291 RepID=A0AAN9UYR8_9ORTH
MLFESRSGLIKRCVAFKFAIKMEEASNVEAQGSGEKALINTQGVEKLSTGLLALYKPELERVKKQLLEFTKKQEALLEQLEAENKNFQEVMETTELHDVMATVKACHGKLTNIKREMGVIHERTARLKVRT